MELLRATANTFGDGDFEDSDGVVAVVEYCGFLTVVSTKTSLLLVLFYQGLLRSFGHFNHDEMLAVYCLAVLAFTPCGDAFSLDSWRRKREKSDRRLRTRIRFC